MQNKKITRDILFNLTSAMQNTSLSKHPTREQIYRVGCAALGLDPKKYGDELAAEEKAAYTSTRTEVENIIDEIISSRESGITPAPRTQSSPEKLFAQIAEDETNSEKSSADTLAAVQTLEAKLDKLLKSNAHVVDLLTGIGTSALGAIEAVNSCRDDLKSYLRSVKAHSTITSDHLAETIGELFYNAAQQGETEPTHE